MVSVQRTAFTVTLLLALVATSAAADGKLDSPASGTDDLRRSAEVTLAWIPEASPAPLTGDPAVRAAVYSMAAFYTIRRTVPEVRLQFSVADERGQQVTGLTQNDFRILDNQSAVQRIQYFSRLQDLPLQLGLLLDVSDSVQKSVVREKIATQLFVQQVLRPRTDLAFLMAFGGDIKVWQKSTGNPSELAGALREVRQPGYATNLYDGLYAACRDQFPQLQGLAPAQRVIVIFSDGDDTDSAHGMQDVIDIAQRDEVQIYAISVHSSRKLVNGDRVLQRLSDETGGRFYSVNSDRDFPFIFAQMEQQMRTQYYVSFRPEQETTGFHTLRLESTGPQQLHVHARQRYYFQTPED
jgi:VWFA-related protein